MEALCVCLEIREGSKMGPEAWTCSGSISISNVGRRQSGCRQSAPSPGFVVQTNMVAVKVTKSREGTVPGGSSSCWGWASFNSCRCSPKAVARSPSARLSAPCWPVCGSVVQGYCHDPEWGEGPQPRVVWLWHRHSDCPGSPHSFLFDSSISFHVHTHLPLFLFS